LFDYTSSCVRVDETEAVTVTPIRKTEGVIMLQNYICVFAYSVLCCPQKSTLISVADTTQNCMPILLLLNRF